MFSKKEKRFENKFIENLDFGTIIVLVDKKITVLAQNVVPPIKQ